MPILSRGLNSRIGWGRIGPIGSGRSSSPTPIDWNWQQFALTAGSDGVQWVGYSDGGPTRPQPAFGSISGQPTPRTDLLALYDDTASGVFLAVFAGDFTARLDGIQISFGGFVMTAFEIELIDGNTWLRFTGLPGDLTPGAVYQVAFGFNLQAAPIITEQPSITPASGRAGTRFVFDVGAAEGRPAPVASGTLTFNGAPVALDPEGGYTPSLPGSLVWSVEWSNGIAPNASAQATVEVADVFTPAELFTSGEVGWYEPLTPGVTLFQDALATTPVTAPGHPVGLSLDASKGLVLGPELVTNGDFVENVEGWARDGGGVVPAWASGELTATGGGQGTGVFGPDMAVVAGRSYRVTFKIRGASAYGLLQFGIRRNSVLNAWLGAAGVPLNVTTADGVLSFIYVPLTTCSDAVFFIRFAGTEQIWLDDVTIKELPGNHFRQPTALNRPIYQEDEEGRGYLAFNGTNQWMQTSEFAWGSGEISMVNGLWKSSDAATGMVQEFSLDVNSNNGSFYMTAPMSAAGAGYGLAQRGTSLTTVNSGLGSFPAPSRNVVSALGLLGTSAILRLRVNGVQRGQLAGGGTGSFGTHSLYRSARAGGGTFFNGRIYPNFGINRLLTPEEQEEAEAWAAKKSGVVL